MANPEGEAALNRLLEGNRRFLAGMPLHPHQSAQRRQEVSAAQAPFAAIVECSDSRLVTDIIFDTGLGDLFVIRTAGHVLGDIGLASVEYAIVHLKVPLVLVMGHSGCGAVAAALSGNHFAGNLGKLVAEITPAVEAARGLPGHLPTQATQIHTRRTIQRLRTCIQPLTDADEACAPLVAGGYYDLTTGAVELLQE